MFNIVLIMFLSFICGLLYLKLKHKEESEKKAKDVKKKLHTLNNNINDSRINKWVRD